MDAGQCGRLARSGRRRRRHLWQHGYLGHLEPDRRPQWRRHVTDVTNASRTMLMNLETLRLGSKPSAKIWAFHCRCCQRSALQRSQVYGYTLADGPFGGKIPVCWRLGRPTSGHRRPSLLQPRRSQEHLRHRLLHDPQHRHRNRALQERPADNLLLQVW